MASGQFRGWPKRLRGAHKPDDRFADSRHHGRKAVRHAGAFQSGIVIPSTQIAHMLPLGSARLAEDLKGLLPALRLSLFAQRYRQLDGPGAAPLPATDTRGAQGGKTMVWDNTGNHLPGGKRFGHAIDLCARARLTERARQPDLSGHCAAHNHLQIPALSGRWSSPEFPPMEQKSLKSQLFMARSERFELPTLGIEIRCSIQLSYERTPRAGTASRR